MKRSIFFLSILVVITASLFAQSTPPSVGELGYRLVSPFYLGGGIHVTKAETPQGTYLNPAIAAGFQRIILDMNYTNLQGLGSAPGMGHAANLGLSVPTKVGVVTGSLGFIDTSAFAGSSLDLGMTGHLNLSFSKEIYSDIWFGAGLVGEIGQIDGALEGGGALSFGFLHFPGSMWGLKNFSWGGSITGLGYRYGSGSRGYLNAIPGNITPAAGLAFDIVDAEKFRWTFRSDLRVPSITDLWFGVSSDLYLGRSARLSLSSSITVRDAIAGSWETIIPSAAIGLNFALDGKRDDDERLTTTELDVQLAAAPLYAGVWGFSGGVTLPFGVRDSNPPKISVEYESPQYISPNYDGTQDELTFSYTVEDERYVTGYKWRIEDESGNTVKTFVNKDERPENESVKNLWDRLISPKEGTALPEAFRWDGVSDSGSMAADGNYQVYMEFNDDNDNRDSIGPLSVVVDTVPPELELQVPEGLDLIFSPDGDGFKDVFTVVQSGSVENLWESDFQDSTGTAVNTWAWADNSPANIEWDGTDAEGEAVPDGVYRYKVDSTDLAGNFSEASIEGIIIDTQRPEIDLTIDRREFSPGTESEITTIVLSPGIPVRSGIVDWRLEVVEDSGDVVRTWSRRESPAIPDAFEFDGKDDNGRRVAEGSYSGLLWLEYGNGFQPEARSPEFVVDVSAPRAVVSTNWSLFSPQGGSRRDTVNFSHETTEEESWTGVLRNSEGQPVKEWTWLESPQDLLVWDGRDEAGRLVPDGRYSYTVRSVDKAGNLGESIPVAVTVDTSAVEASLTASLDVFGPTGNGTKDEVLFYLNARTDSPVSDWSLEVVDDSGGEIRRWSGEGSLPDNVIWNGRRNDRSVAEDGFYRGELTVNYTKGDIAEAVTGSIEVDTNPPMIEASIDEGLFSPDQDGEKDVLEIRQTSSTEEFFEARILDSSNREVRRWQWPGNLESFEWDGTDDSGNDLNDGDYRYLVSGVDKAGNETRREIRGIRIDTAPTPVYLTAKEGYIKAGEIDPERMQSFTAVVPNDEGVASWSFTIQDEEGRRITTESGSGGVPSEFQWNGTDRAGSPAEGVFKGVLTVVYDKGSRPQAESRPFISDGSPPDLGISLNPQPFSPDGDNVDDEIVIGISVEDRSRISEWSLEIFDPREREFITFAGRGRPSERIIWDGRSGRGELVESAEDYPYVLTVSDVLGHTAIERGSIPVDVLVIREGDRLKILINNITFQPSSPRLTLTGEEGEKNVQVLDRLAEIMRKYGSYRIIVEGHAVSLNWANPSAAKREQDDILVPLSQSRAQTVVDELATRGISRNRLSALGIGGEEPIVPHGDLEERWRNRRVEFYLEK